MTKLSKEKPSTLNKERFEEVRKKRDNIVNNNKVVTK